MQSTQLYTELTGNPYKPVKSKRDFYTRFLKNEFGNRTRVWDCIDALVMEKPACLLHLRNTKQAGGTGFYNLTLTEAIKLWPSNKEHWVCAEMAPTHLTVLQGEVMRQPGGLYFFGSRVKKPMRDSLREGGFSVSGIVAQEMIREAMDATSYDWLNVLLDRYDDHVIEFSCYESPCGTLDLSSIVWEVRTY